MKDDDDKLKLVIVRDMWLTGFDAPSMHTLYIDKPMKGHNLMQAIARVNRVYKDKIGGLVVDYLGIASDLKEALSFYSDAGGRGDPAEVQEEAVTLMQEKAGNPGRHDAWIRLQSLLCRNYLTTPDNYS